MSINLNPAESQLIVDKVNLNERNDITYVQLNYKIANILKHNINISVDFGQDEKLTRRGKDNIYNIKGDIIKFQSVIGAINHLENNGWSLFAIDNNITGGGESSISVDPKYLFRRKE